MNSSEHNGNQNIDPLKDKTTEGLPKKVWNRLSDRSKLPRLLWFPPKRHLDLDADEWQRQHDEVSKSLRRTMITLLGYSFFCMLTLAAPDDSLIARDAKIKVPFAGTEVSYQAFLIIGPLIMFALAMYLHILLGHWLSLGKHKDTFGLPYIGKHKDTFGLPYIFNIDNKTANWLANFIFYWLPCLVLALFSWKALPRPNESFLLIIQTAIFFTCMVVLRIQRLPDDHHRFKFNAFYLFVWLLGGFLLLGTQVGFYERDLDLFRADLGKKDLRNAYLFKAILTEADLNGADLSKANLTGANLTGANLSKANLREANLRAANLSRAYLHDANLSGANLSVTNLHRADLSKVDLSGVDLSKAYLHDAKLSGANLSGDDLYRARLSGVNLTGVNLSKANLREAYLRRTDLTGVDLSKAYLHNAKLSGANLAGANLSGADLYRAKLSGTDMRYIVIGANLWDANLSGANLSKAYLRGAKGLTVEQLCKASTLYEAKLDQELETQIKQECPDLLKEPQKINPDEKK